MPTVNQARVALNASPMAALLAERVLTHVAAGGFLGANAEHYSMAQRDDAGRIVRSGWYFPQQDIADAWRIAEEVNPNLWVDSQDNIPDASEEFTWQAPEEHCYVL